MVKRLVSVMQKHIHFVTFSCYKRRKHLQHDLGKRIVIRIMASRAANSMASRIGSRLEADDEFAVDL